MSKKRPRLTPGQRPDGDNGAGSWTVPSTPTSLRRMQAAGDAQAPTVLSSPLPPRSVPAARRDARPVEDVPALLVGSTDDKGPLNTRGKFDEHKFSGSHRREDERQAHYRMDKAGKPCACDDRTPCLAHAALTGRRRHVRPD